MTETSARVAAGTASARPALPHGDLTQEVLGAFFRVYGELGYGFLEHVYLKALAIELSYRGIPVSREMPVSVFYKGVTVGTYRADLIAGHEIVIAVKAGEDVSDSDRFQLLNYLRCSGKEIGLLLHFGPHAVSRRVLRTGQGVAIGSAEETMADAASAASRSSVVDA